MSQRSAGNLCLFYPEEGSRRFLRRIGIFRPQFMSHCNPRTVNNKSVRFIFTTFVVRNVNFIHTHTYIYICIYVYIYIYIYKRGDVSWFFCVCYVILTPFPWNQVVCRYVTLVAALYSKLCCLKDNEWHVLINSCSIRQITVSDEEGETHERGKDIKLCRRKKKRGEWW